MKLLWIIIGIAIYFGGGWIAKDIVFSMIETTNETTLRDIIFYECLIYSVIALLFYFISEFYGPVEGLHDSMIPVLLIGGAVVLVYALPYSIGLMILYNIINIGGIIWGICANSNID